jgi:hypothetical protein
MRYLKKIYQLVDNYLIARLYNRPSTALFWYLPEPSNIKSKQDLIQYQTLSKPASFYFIDYRQKLNYSLTNHDNIIVLPYDQPIGNQINPEAAFQYALGLHDQFYKTNDQTYLQQFLNYANYFLKKQTPDGFWSYDFNWFTSKAPWYSALAQARGASVMLRAGLITQDNTYLTAAKNAVSQFLLPTAAGGFLHIFSKENCPYFEEYPQIPTGVINGFMACLMSIWELHYWLKENWLNEMWTLGINSLQAMLPHYSNGWWSLYDLDENSPILNVNSPRYHLMEIHYLQVLSILSASPILQSELHNRTRQYHNSINKLRALGLKFARKIMYR